LVSETKNEISKSLDPETGLFFNSPRFRTWFGMARNEGLFFNVMLN